MKKMSWLDKPITWRSSFKVSGISMAISAIITAGYYCYFFWDEICDWFDDKAQKVKAKLSKQ